LAGREVFFIWGMTTVSGALIRELHPMKYLMENFGTCLTQGWLMLVSLALWRLLEQPSWGECGLPTKSEDVLLLDIEEMVHIGQPRRSVLEAILLYWGNRNVYHDIFGIWPSESARWHENMRIRQYMGRRCIGETHGEAISTPTTIRDFAPLPPPVPVVHNSSNSD
jgi:hypothetical protein